MKNSFFINENQLREWIEAAENIGERFGLNKALSYVIGEKFYNIVTFMRSARKIIHSIDEQREKANYQPICEFGQGENKSIMNLDLIYEEQTNLAIAAQEVLIEFAALIKKSFNAYDIQRYFDSNPRLGIFGHACSEEEHRFLVEMGAVEHSLDTELEDALIIGEMIQYLEVKI